MTRVAADVDPIDLLYKNLTIISFITQFENTRELLFYNFI